MLIKTVASRMNKGLEAVLSFSEQLRGWTKSVDKKSRKPCKYWAEEEYIFLKTRMFGGRYNYAGKMPGLRPESCEKRKDKIRFTKVALSRLFTVVYSKNREHNEASSKLFDLAVQQTKAERYARRRKDF